MTDERKSDPVVDALFALLSDYAYRDVTLAMVADKAGVSLSALRGATGSKFAILERFAAAIDAEVLAGLDAELDQEGAHERLFDILMRRLDVLLPHREAIRSLRDGAREDPALALGLWRLATRSQRWMLAGADLASEGARGHIAARGLALSFAQLIDVWLDDEDPGLARTMAALDARLRRGDRAMRALDTLHRVTAPLRLLVGRALDGRRRKASGARHAADDEAGISTRH